MDDLIARIRAAIDEDERVLTELERQLADGGENMEGGWSVWGRFGQLADRFMQPKRWRAEVTGRRAILAEHQLTVSKHEQLPYDALTGERNPDSYDVECARCGWVSSDPASGCPSLLALAKGYGIDTPA